MKNQEEIYRSVCRVCHGGCGALLSVKAGKLVKVAPDPDSPFNRGRMCIKGPATPEMMYHTSRLLVPLKRIGARGSNRWEKVTWDTALGDIVNRIDTIRETSGP
ncbi:MAG: molybdopterin oxidoreductase, partial [Syntrophales bacterium]